MLKQKLLVAEAPKHAHARHAAVLGCHDVHVAVANVDGTFLVNAQFAQGFNHRVGSRLLTNVLAFTNGHRHQVAKEMTTELAGGGIKLVAHHGNVLALSLQLLKQLHDAGVGLCGVEVMLHVMLAEGGEGFLKQRVVQTIGYGTFHELLHAVAHKAAHLIERALGHVVCAQGIVGACCEVSECAQQGAVKIKNISLIFVHLLSYSLSFYFVSAFRRAIYLPRMSNSMFTTEPTSMSQKFVLS